MTMLLHEPRKIGRAVIIACLLLSVFKFWLIRNEEIVAFRAPNDAEFYLTSARAWYWDRPYEEKAFIHLPAYPLWIAMTDFFNVPLRLATEALLLVSAFAFAAVLVRAGQSRIVGVVIFALIVFNPWTIHIFRQVVPDTIYAPILLLSLAAMIELLVETRRRRRVFLGVLAGLALAVLWQCREENQLIAIYLAAMGVIALWRLPEERRGSRGRAIELTLVVGVPVMIVLLISTEVKFINYMTTGLWTADDVATRGFEAANRALVRIRPEHPVRRVPVTREQRKLAYEVSPAFAEMRPFFEGPAGDAWAAFGKAAGLKGEISGGSFLWAMREAATSNGHHNSALDADAYYQRIANEINNACDDGRLPSRFVFSSFIDPSLKTWLPGVPSSAMAAVQILTQTSQPMLINEYVYDTPAATVDLFNDVANRRTDSISNRQVTIRGWALCPGDVIERIDIRGFGLLLGTTNTFTPRPDVFFRFFGIPRVPMASGFKISVPLAAHGEEKARLVFRTRQHGPVRVACWMDDYGVIHFDSADGKSVMFEIEDVRMPPPASKIDREARNILWASYGRFVWWLFPIGLLAVVILFALRRRLRLREDPTIAIVALLLIVFATRVALFVVLDASAWPCLVEPRYLLPVTGVYVAAMLILVSAAVTTIFTRRRGDSVRTAVGDTVAIAAKVP